MSKRAPWTPQLRPPSRERRTEWTPPSHRSATPPAPTSRENPAQRTAPSHGKVASAAGSPHVLGVSADASAAAAASKASEKFV